jgi:uncharacterized protein involved in exopolysaccharide biosynthesis
MSLKTNTPIACRQKPEITPVEVWNFLCEAKWFVLGGMILSPLIATIYLLFVPPIYLSKVTVQVTPSFKDPISGSLVANTVISSVDLVEQLSFDQTLSQITEIMNMPEGDPKIKLIDEALKTATSTKSGTFLNLFIKGNSPEKAEKLARELSHAIVIYIISVNQRNIIFLQKALSVNKAKLISGSKQIELQNKILDLDIAIDSAKEYRPTIVNGPSLSPKPISPNKKSVILLALFLGAVTGCLAYYLKSLLLKKE